LHGYSADPSVLCGNAYFFSETINESQFCSKATLLRSSANFFFALVVCGLEQIYLPGTSAVLHASSA